MLLKVATGRIKGSISQDVERLESDMNDPTLRYVATAGTDYSTVLANEKRWA